MDLFRAIQEFFDSKPENFYKDGIIKFLYKWSDIVENNGVMYLINISVVSFYFV